MSNKKKEIPVEPILSDEVDPPQVQQAKLDALEAEVLTLNELVGLLKEENAVLKQEIAAVRDTANTTANSVSIAPTPPPAPERPTVEIGGERYRFKVGEVRLSAREVAKATDIADDETRLAEVFGKFPGLFEKL